MQVLSEWMYRKSTTWVALISLILFLAFSALVLPGQSAAAESYSAGAGSPDTSLFYSSGDLYRMAETYGDEGRQAYIRARFTFDLAFPLVYGFFLTACISWQLNHSKSLENPWRLLNLAPLAGVLFDFLENISTALVIGRYPSTTPIVPALAPFFTLIKWIFVGGSFGLLIIGAGLSLLKWFRNKWQ
jgi:hypothetical protein